MLDKNKQFSVGQEYVIEITGLGNSGEGVGKIDGFTVFVLGALPEEIVKVKLQLVKKAYAIGELLTIIKKSTFRVIPKCTIFADCGGCQLQHLSYNAQLANKKEKVEQAIKRIGYLSEINVLDVLGEKEPWYYRNKMMFPVSGVLGRAKIGCYAKSSHVVIDTKDCFIQNEQNNLIMNIVRTWMNEYSIKPYDEKSKQGTIRHVMGRVSVKTGDVMLALVSKSYEIAHIDELIKSLKKQLVGLKSVVQFVKKDNSNIVLSGKERLIYGDRFIQDKIGDFVFNISAKSFFQVNSQQTEVLYNEAIKLANLTGEQTVIELYCGTGTISLFLAQKAKKVIGIEIVEQAIIDAKKNAQNNGSDNVEFIVGDVAEKLPQLVKKGIKADVLVVDPPRAGCDKKVLDSILQIKAKKLVYISCNPASLARDLAILSDGGYKVKVVQPVDMFPMTSHVETVVELVI